jgi:ATP-binding cassette subfamily F protein uup
VLLLDEPTNHLDLEGIEWLEELLQSSGFAFVVVSHDRRFLENSTHETVELNRMYTDGLLRVKGSYSKFLEDREAWLESEHRAQESLRNRVRTEVEWLRRGPKARTTKAKARIDNANALIAQLQDSQSRSVSLTAGIAFDATQRQTKRLIEMEDVTVTLGDREILRSVTFSLTAGLKLGLVGPNGSGKTTLLRAMTGDLPLSSGEVRRAPALRITYLSQLRELDTSLTLRRTLAPDSDSVIYQDRVIHVAGYASRFLFTGEQLNQPVSRLSGGERARVLIARLMLQPSEILILDEPTNDLDIPTLEILEEALLEFPGALVLVTHDRFLLDRVTNAVLGLDTRGNAVLFADYIQWEEWRDQFDASRDPAAAESRPSQSPAAQFSTPAGQKKKLSYLEQREYNTIEERIAAADEILRLAHAQVEDPGVTTNAAALTQALAALESAQIEHDALYQRWLELTEKIAG